MEHLYCPVCQQGLDYHDADRVLRCEQGHSYDRARQGYFNLLLPQHKKSKHPGDTAEMVAARRHFLDAGHYLPLLKTIKTLLTEHVPSVHAYTDLACGEGYYTQHVHEQLTANGQVVSSGVDISTPAIKAACRRSDAIQWLVASMTHLPIASVSQDLISCLFCRLAPGEVRRTLKPGAFFLVAETGPTHLDALREQLYRDAGQVKRDLKQAGSSMPKEIDGFAVCQYKHVQQELTLDCAGDIAHLLTMTPHYWRSTEEAKQRLLAQSSLSVQLDFRLTLYQKAD